MPPLIPPIFLPNLRQRNRAPPNHRQEPDGEKSHKLERVSFEEFDDIEYRGKSALPGWNRQRDRSFVC
jgi:hypothetical protein